ncbi:MAG: TdeIII family type II restriction endonuclease [Candidatus Levybacteria bacterium]|nr:TdeIII family type II restriction endonuclease [Candidatus Levybacteria bacterium]
MSLPQEKKERISEVIKTILVSRIDNFPELNHQNRNAPFHDLILEAFEKQLKPINVPTPYLVAIASWMHGLNTSLGSGFESLAHILSGGYKRNFTQKFTLKVKKSQAENIGNIIVELKSGIKPATQRENEAIFKFNKGETEVNALEFTVDNYIETANLIEGIELKSVRPNSGEGRGEKQKILYAKAAFKLLHPEKEIKYYIGFPFDPTSKTAIGYDKERFFNYLVEFKKFFTFNEVLLSSELWDHLSEQKNTMEEIFEIISKTIEVVKASNS